MRCWGYGDQGRLGYGDEVSIGVSDVPADHDPVTLGGPVRTIASGGAHSCAVFDDESLTCWGENGFGQLGYGFDYNVGDDELPVVAGRVSFL